jgi:hypothetical protein
VRHAIKTTSPFCRGKPLSGTPAKPSTARSGGSAHDDSAPNSSLSVRGYLFAIVLSGQSTQSRRQCRASCPESELTMHRVGAVREDWRVSSFAARRKWPVEAQAFRGAGSFGPGRNGHWRAPRLGNKTNHVRNGDGHRFHSGRVGADERDSCANNPRSLSQPIRFPSQDQGTCRPQHHMLSDYRRAKMTINRQISQEDSPCVAIFRWRRIMRPRRIILQR